MACKPADAWIEGGNPPHRLEPLQNLRCRAKSCRWTIGDEDENRCKADIAQRNPNG